MAYRTPNPLARYNFTGPGYDGYGGVGSGISAIANALLMAPQLRAQAEEAAAKGEYYRAGTAKTVAETGLLTDERTGRGELADLFASFPEIQAGLNAQADLSGIQGWMAAAGAQGDAAAQRGAAQADLDDLPARIAAAGASLPAAEQGNIPGLWRFVVANNSNAPDAQLARAVTGSGQLIGENDAVSLGDREGVATRNQTNRMAEQTLIQDATTGRQDSVNSTNRDIAGLEEGGRMTRHGKELAQVLGIAIDDRESRELIAALEEQGRLSRSEQDRLSREYMADEDRFAASTRNAADNDRALEVAGLDNDTRIKINDDNQAKSIVHVIVGHNANGTPVLQAMSRSKYDALPDDQKPPVWESGLASIITKGMESGGKVTASDTGRIDGEITAQTEALGYPMSSEDMTRIRIDAESRMKNGDPMAKAVADSLAAAGAKQVGGGDWLVSNRTELSAGAETPPPKQQAAPQQSTAQAPQKQPLPPRRAQLPDGRIAEEMPDGRWKVVPE